jgi:hypothetical protein
MQNMLISPDQLHIITFGELQEQRMGGAYYCPIILDNMLLHERSTGNAVWNLKSTRVYFPIWFSTADNGLMHKIAFYDLLDCQLGIFETQYSFIQIEILEQDLLKCTLSPHWQPKEIQVNLVKEKIESLQKYTQIDADIIEIKQRLYGATGGQWHYIQEGRDQTSGSSFIMTNVNDADDWKNPNRGEDLYIIGATHTDCDFIAHARQDIPVLLAEIERLRALLGAL